MRAQVKFLTTLGEGIDPAKAASAIIERVLGAGPDDV